MKCTNCGNDINPNEKFCGSCGAKISENTQVTNNANINNTKSTSMNKQAIGSIACSIICLFIFWWLGIAGIILGAQALKEIKETNESGKELAYAGITIGVIAVLLSLQQNSKKKAIEPFFLYTFSFPLKHIE